MNKRLFISSSGWYLFSSFFLRGIGLITTPIFSRILTKSEFGLLENFNALLSIMLIVSSLCYSSTLIRARFDHAGNEPQYIKTGLLFSTLAVIFLTLIFVLFRNKIENFMQLDDKFFVVLLLVMLFNPALELFSNYSKLNYQYRLLSGVNISVGVIGVLLSFVFLALMNDNLFARVLGAQSPVVLFGLFFYFRYCINGRGVKAEYITYALPICIPIIIHSISGAILNSSDRMMITSICGAEYNAYYSIACSCSQLVYILWFSMNSAFVPLFSERMNEKKYTDIRSFSNYYIIVFALAVIGMLLIAPDVVLILGGKQYFDACFSVPAVMMSYVLLFLYSLYVNVEQFEKKTKGMAIATTGCALINVYLNIIFIPKYGYIAAAYTTMAGYLLMLLFHYVVLKHHRFDNLYNNRLIFSVAFSGLVLSVLMPIIYSYNVFRYIVLALYIVIMLVLIYRFKDRIFKLIKADGQDVTV